MHLTCEWISQSYLRSEESIGNFVVDGLSGAVAVIKKLNIETKVEFLILQLHLYRRVVVMQTMTIISIP